jgi:hypothetical protein
VEKSTEIMSYDKPNNGNWGLCPGEEWPWGESSMFSSEQPPDGRDLMGAEDGTRACECWAPYEKKKYRKWLETE